MLSITELVSVVAAIGVPAVTGSLYLIRKRRRDREANRLALAAKWTNEGEVTGEPRATIISLYLASRAGDVTGELESPGWPRGRSRRHRRIAGLATRRRNNYDSQPLRTNSR